MSVFSGLMPEEGTQERADLMTNLMNMQARQPRQNWASTLAQIATMISANKAKSAVAKRESDRKAARGEQLRGVLGNLDGPLSGLAGLVGDDGEGLDTVRAIARLMREDQRSAIDANGDGRISVGERRAAGQLGGGGGGARGGGASPSPGPGAAPGAPAGGPAPAVPGDPLFGGPGAAGGPEAAPGPGFLTRAGDFMADSARTVFDGMADTGAPAPGSAPPAAPPPGGLAPAAPPGGPAAPGPAAALGGRVADAFNSGSGPLDMMNDGIVKAITDLFGGGGGTPTPGAPSPVRGGGRMDQTPIAPSPLIPGRTLVGARPAPASNVANPASGPVDPVSGRGAAPDKGPMGNDARLSLLGEAKDAVEQGADPAAVKARLTELGIDSALLDSNNW